MSMPKATLGVSTPRGLRRGEACGLHRVDYDRTRKKITIAWQVV